MRLRAASARNLKSRPGFTLVELLLVVAIGIIITAVTLPAAMNLYRGELTDDAGHIFEDVFRRARNQAVANMNNLPHGVKLVTASSSLVIFAGESYAGRNQALDEIVPYSDTVGVQATSTEIVFSRFYGTSTASGIWTLNYGTWTKRLTIGTYGTVSLE